LPNKIWASQDKDIVDKNKKRIQNDFKNKLGLLVDVPRTGVDDNTAQRFYHNAERSAEMNY